MSIQPQVRDIVQGIFGPGPSDPKVKGQVLDEPDAEDRVAVAWANGNVTRVEVGALRKVGRVERGLQQVLALPPLADVENDVVDLFAGAGGFSDGAREAGLRTVWAGNHDRLACATFERAHPGVVPFCQDLHQANWSLVPRHGGMLAAPCCQGHSPSRGKDKPHHDASRSTAWAVVSCAERHRPRWFVVENVPAFRNWVLYPAWASAMEALGYALAPHILNAADFGVPQERERLFIVGTRSRAPLQLHFEPEERIPASAILEPDEAVRWSPIIKTRGRPRAPRTLAQIARARREGYGDRFLIPYYGEGSGLTGRRLDRPLGTITTIARWALVNGDKIRMLTIRESTRGMSFREDYPLPRVQRAALKLLGNAVCPRLAARFLRELRNRL